MLFAKISELFTENDIINFSVRKTGDELTVSVMITVVKSDDDKKQFPPLLLKGTASEIDQEIYNILKEPMSKINGEKQLTILGKDALDEAIKQEQKADEKSAGKSSAKPTKPTSGPSKQAEIPVKASPTVPEEPEEPETDEDTPEPTPIPAKPKVEPKKKDPKKVVKKSESKYAIPEEVLKHIESIKEQKILDEKFKDLGKVQLASQKTSLLLEKYKDSHELKDLQTKIRAATHRILMDDDDEPATEEVVEDDESVEAADDDVTTEDDEVISDNETNDDDF